METTKREQNRRPRQTSFQGPARWTTAGIQPLVFYGLFISLSALGLYLQWEKHLGAAGRHPDYYWRAWLVSGPAALAFAAVVLFLDRHEREPWKLLLIAFLWGALGTRAILWPARDLLEQVRLGRVEHFVNKFRSDYIDKHGVEIPDDFVWGTEEGRARGIEETEGVVEVVIDQVERSSIGPFLEELSKAVILFLLFLLLPHEFDGVLDGILYGVLVGLGFAMVENVRYLFEAQADPAPGLCISQAFRKAVLNRIPGYPGHALLAGLSGAGLGLARTARREWQRWLAPPLGFALTVTAHMLWNSLDKPVENKLLPVFGPVVLLYLPLLVLTSQRESKALAHHLPPAGVTPYTRPDDIRRRWSRWRVLWRAFRDLGGRGFRHVSRLQRVLVEWAFVRWHVAEGHVAAIVDPEETEEHYKAQASILARAVNEIYAAQAKS